MYLVHGSGQHQAQNSSWNNLLEHFNCFLLVLTFMLQLLKTWWTQGKHWHGDIDVPGLTHLAPVKVDAVCGV